MDNNATQGRERGGECAVQTFMYVSTIISVTLSKKLWGKMLYAHMYLCVLLCRAVCVCTCVMNDLHLTAVSIFSY